MKRFHLSALLLLTALAGAFLLTQLRERRTTLELKEVSAVEVRKGAPFTYSRSVEYTPRKLSALLDISDVPQDLFSYSAIVVNCLIGFAGLALAGCVSEKIIRRRNPK